MIEIIIELRTDVKCYLLVISVPCLRGMAPTRKATDTSLKATDGSNVGMTSVNNVNAQSANSMTTPSKTPIIGSISNNVKITFCSLPKTSPIEFK